MLLLSGDCGNIPRAGKKKKEKKKKIPLQAATSS
jgi:hypothetical protein